MNNRSAITKKRKIYHAPDFKRKVALEYLTSGKTTRQIAEKYPPVHYTLVALWAKQLRKKLKVEASVTLPIPMEKITRKAKKSFERDEIKEAEAVKEKLELANLKIAGLETMIDIAEDQLGIDIRKKSGTKQSQ